MIVDFLIEDFANRAPYDTLPKDYNIWYVGIENTIEEGLDRLLTNLNRKGHIIIGELEIVDYSWIILKNEIIYVILYRSLPKLEYLEYKSEEYEKRS